MHSKKKSDVSEADWQKNETRHIQMGLSENVSVSKLRSIDFTLLTSGHVNPSGRAFSGVGLQPLAFWVFGFESRRVDGCLVSVSVVCYEVEVSA